MSLTVLVELTMKPEHRDEFREFMKQGVPMTRDCDGCELVEAHESQDESGSFMFREIWRDRESQEKFAAAGQELPQFQTMLSWMAAPPVVRYFDSVDV